MIRKAVMMDVGILTSSYVSTSSDTYVLSTGEAGAQRLDVQSHYMHKESVDHLAKAGLKKGQIVCDIGCGNGYMTRYMASVVGTQGHVYAVDVSSAQLELAKKRIEEAGFTNVTFIQANILDDSNLAIPPADLVYSRLLLMHLTDPSKGIRKMLGLLKTNGALALHECIASTGCVSGDANQLQGFVNAILASGKYFGLDYDIGLRLKTLAEEQGLKDVKQNEHQYEFSPDFARDILMMTLNDWGGWALKEKVISEDEYAAFAEEIKQLSKPVWASKGIYITGQKL